MTNVQRIAYCAWTCWGQWIPLEFGDPLIRIVLVISLSLGCIFPFSMVAGGFGGEEGFVDARRRPGLTLDWSSIHVLVNAVAGIFCFFHAGVRKVGAELARSFSGGVAKGPEGGPEIACSESRRGQRPKWMARGKSRSRRRNSQCRSEKSGRAFPIHFEGAGRAHHGSPLDVVNGVPTSSVERAGYNI